MLIPITSIITAWQALSQALPLPTQSVFCKEISMTVLTIYSECIQPSLCESHERVAAVYLRRKQSPLRRIWRSCHGTWTSGIHGVTRHTQMPVLFECWCDLPVSVLQSHLGRKFKVYCRPRIAGRIQTTWSTHQLKIVKGESTKDLPNDCHMLNKLLQVSSRPAYQWSELTMYISMI